jgi:hypothetical protein
MYVCAFRAHIVVDDKLFPSSTQVQKTNIQHQMQIKFIPKTNERKKQKLFIHH